MKAISLIQPYAILVAIGAKRIETRSWSTHYRGPLAIHASKQIPQWAVDLCHTLPFKRILAAAGITQVNQLPRGAVLAVADLVSVQPVFPDSTGWRWTSPREREYVFALSQTERALGDYTPKRFAWLLDDVRQVGPIQGVRGSLGLWECESSFLPKGL